MPNSGKVFDSAESPEEIGVRAILAMDSMLGYWDNRLRCGFANEAYRTWFGIAPSDLKGLPIQQLLGPIYELNQPYIRAALRGEAQVFERAIPLPDGTVRHSIARYQPDIHCGTLRGFTAQVTDVTQIKRIELELSAARLLTERAATHDQLTGLPNRAGLMERVHSAIHQAKAAGRLAAVVHADMEGLKKINDMFGYDMGDHVLTEVARRMRRALSPSDSVTRLGGDQFLFALGQLDAANGMERALNRLRMTVMQPLKHKGLRFHPQFCCGVAVYPWHGVTAMELLAKAGRALFKARRQGGGWVEFAQSA